MGKTTHQKIEQIPTLGLQQIAPDNLQGRTLELHNPQLNESVEVTVPNTTPYP